MRKGAATDRLQQSSNIMERIVLNFIMSVLQTGSWDPRYFQNEIHNNKTVQSNHSQINQQIIVTLTPQIIDL